MQTAAALWLDDRQAVIVTISENRENRKRITSSIEKQLRLSGRSRPRPTYESSDAADGDSRERDYRSQPAEYFEEIFAHISAAGLILIFGPGQATVELKKRIEHNLDTVRIVQVEAAAEMTEDELSEKLREVVSHGSVTGKATPPGKHAL